jgi:predicted enzyme related to lactoylglutathione lyase
LQSLSGSVTHFEIYAEEPATLAGFYQQLFGWRFERAPGRDYWRIETGAALESGFVGGLTYRPVAGARSWVHYVHVASLDASVAEAERLGAAVLRPRTAVPKTAWYAVLADPEGNIFAIYQEDTAAFTPSKPD